MQKKKSIFPVLTIAIALGLSLSYFTLFNIRSTSMSGAGLAANSGIILAQTTGTGGLTVPASRTGTGGLTVPSNSGGNGLENPLGNRNGTLATFLDTLLKKVILPIGAIVVVFAIIFAGFKYVTAKGDPKAIQAAHHQLTWTAIGAAILLGATVISQVITNTVDTLTK